MRRAGLALVALTLLAGPTVGDIGSCGQSVEELDPLKFFAQKQLVDCRACTQCGIVNATCERTCTVAIEEASFPEDCFPLAHDGEVCLNALDAASCDDWVGYLDDVAPTAPTECNFCPPDRKPGASP